MAIGVSGLWDEGFVIDMYSESSKYIGEDAFGKKHFETTYTPSGNLLHSMKYNGHNDNSKALAEICAKFMSEWLADKKVDVILSVPPTQRRDIQPVFLIAEAISAITGILYSNDVLIKTGFNQAKFLDNKNKIDGSIVMSKPAKRRCNILLIDDIYNTGSTANECTRVLKSDPLVDKVYYLAIGKTRDSKGLI